nr:MAG TPA: hypothetical protein [Caudoviricetes sp.]
METIPTATIIHQAAALYLNAFDAHQDAATVTTAANLSGQMQAILDMIIAMGLSITDVMLETRRIIAEEAAK